MDIASKVIKFVIEGLDCYIKIGFANTTIIKQYPHMAVGDICYIDLTISRGADEMREYEVLMTMANMALLKGAAVADVADVLIGHNFRPQGFVRHKGESHFYGSICDFIGKRLKYEVEHKT